ncbi:hypothetical protein ACI2OX_17195 [Bacillus sp. N9]
MITKTASYLDSVNYNDKSGWLPDKLFYYDNFKKTFGFDPVYDGYINGRSNQMHFAHLDWNQNPIINIDGYERMVHLYISSNKGGIDANQKFQLRSMATTIH